MKTKNIKKLILTFLNLFVYFGLFSFVSAVDYTLLEPLPGIESVSTRGFGEYLSSMFSLAISVAAILAVVQLSIAGFKYLTEESFTGKTDARKKITNAFIGLILLLSSYLLLRTINPDLVENEFDIPTVTPGAVQTVDDGLGASH